MSAATNINYRLTADRVSISRNFIGFLFVFNPCISCLVFVQFNYKMFGFFVYRVYCRLGRLIKWTNNPDFNCITYLSRVLWDLIIMPIIMEQLSLNLSYTNRSESLYCLMQLAT